jgi:hypothetical protein
VNDLRAGFDALESGVSLGFMVVAAFASALVWLWAMLSQLALP